MRIRNKDGLRPDGQQAERGYEIAFQEVLAQYGAVRMNGAVASNRTQAQNAEVVFAGLTVWHEKLPRPMRIQKPANLTDNHIRALVRYWYEQGKKPKTMVNDLSVWRKFCGWIGKGNLVLKLADYLPDVPSEQLVVNTTARVSKSWSESGIDTKAKIAEAFRVDPLFGWLLMVQLVFGLRMQEALCLKPHKSDHGNGLKVYGSDGAKNGRERFLEFEHEEQRRVLDAVKAMTTVSGRLGWSKSGYGKDTTLKSNVQHYYYCLRKIGITKKNANVCGHGLRAEYAENCAIAKGLLPASLGGTADQMPKEDMDRILAQVSENLGHSRVQITASYFGKMAKMRPDKKEEVAAKLKPVPESATVQNDSGATVPGDPEASQVEGAPKEKTSAPSDQPGAQVKSPGDRTGHTAGKVCDG